MYYSVSTHLSNTRKYIKCDLEVYKTTSKSFLEKKSSTSDQEIVVSFILEPIDIRNKFVNILELDTLNSRTYFTFVKKC